MLPIEPIVLVHGGAGDIPKEREAGKLLGVKLAAKVGYEKLRQTGCVLDAVEEAVRSMELDPYFNAGYGSVLTIDGNVEMEASIMCGTTIRAGCVSLVKDIMHPISLARKVMKTPHNFLAGDGAMRFAKDEGFEIMEPAGKLVTEYGLEALEEWKEGQRRGDIQFARTEIGSSNKYKGEGGTVGAVAIDSNGNIAVATSTGGITGKLSGRVGDTPLVGCGTYADNRVGGVSTTGHGETIMKYCLAHDIMKRMEYIQEDAQKATENSCRKMTERLIGTAGAITIDAKGQVGVSFTSKRMAWAYLKSSIIKYGIEKGQIIEEAIDD